MRKLILITIILFNVLQGNSQLVTINVKPYVDANCDGIYEPAIDYPYFSYLNFIVTKANGTQIPISAWTAPFFATFQLNVLETVTVSVPYPGAWVVTTPSITITANGSPGANNDYVILFCNPQVLAPIPDNTQDTTSITTVCENGNFESINSIDWSEWHTAYGYFKGSSYDILNSNYTYGWGVKETGSTNAEFQNKTNACSYYLSCVSDQSPNNTINTDGYINNLNSDYLPQNQIHHQIVTNGYDPIIPFLPRTHGNSGKLLKLGNSAAANGFEFIEKKFVVNAGNSNFSFWYAFVMSNPVHGPGEDQYFGVNVYNITGNLLHDITNISGSAGVNVNVGTGLNYTFSSDMFSQVYALNSFCIPTAPIPSGMNYKNWNFVNIDLSNQVSNTIVIRIWTRDCAHCGDFAYAYLDDFCSTADVNNPTGSIALGNSDACGAGQICVNYTLPINTNIQGSAKLFLNLYQNGNTTPTTTLNSGNTWLTGTSPNPYCFAITPAILSSLNSSNNYFDYSVQADFQLGNTSLPSQYIGLNGLGQDITMNNDYRIDCLTPCDFNADAGPDKFICNGASTILGATPGGLIYSWTSTPVGFTSAIANPTVMPTTLPTTFHLEVSNANTNCPAKTDDVIVSEDPNCQADCCSASHWEGPITIRNKDIFGNKITGTFDCTDPKIYAINVANKNCERDLIISGTFVCGNSKDCKSKVIYSLTNQSTGAAIIQTNSIELPANLPGGNYILKYEAWCGDKLCDVCEFEIKKDCKKQIDYCKGGYWEKLPVLVSQSDDKEIMILDCKAPGKIVFNPKINSLYCNADLTIDAGSYICNKKGCLSKIVYTLSNNNSAFMLTDVGNINISGSLPNGQYTLKVEVYCGDNICQSCEFPFIKNCKTSCDCKTANCTFETYCLDKPCGTKKYFDCKKDMKLKCNKAYLFSIDLKCIGNCLSTVTAELLDASGTVIQSQSNVSAINPLNVIFTTPGANMYKIRYRILINGKECDKCSVNIYTVCPKDIKPSHKR